MLDMTRITLAEGSGGLEMARLLERLIFAKVPDWMKSVEKGLGIDHPDDAAAIPLPSGGYLVVSVDSYTVSPLFFPGGDLGLLAAAGTINDVLMLGGRPVAVLDSIVVEEGLEYETLELIVDSMVRVFMSEGVGLIGGDLKVMPRGQLDQVLITTVGLGFADRIIADKNIVPSDKIVISGEIGEHGAAIMAAQQMLEGHDFRSDVKPLTKLMAPLVEKFGDVVDAARDPTRGGVAMVLYDWAKSSKTTIIVDESELPVRDSVVSFCEMMGIDPLTLASEGSAVLAVRPDFADEVVEFMHSAGFTQARVVGEVRESEGGLDIVVMKTVIGGYRVLQPPTGEIVPRIC